MTKPKRHLPGQVAFITRRTTQRHFFLRPGKDIRELVGYLYGKALHDHQQQSHAASCISTHIHSHQTDLEGTRSDFMQQCFSNISRKRNLQLDRRENLWSSEEPGDTVLLDLETIIDKVVYTCLQPVAAGLVDKAEDWTGFMILPRHWGTPMRFPRPEHCGDDMPEHVEFTPMPPPGFEDKPLEVVIAFFEELIEREEKRLRKKRKFDVLGIEYCEAINPFATPKSKAPMRRLNPRFACKDKKLIVAALQRQRRFFAEHRRLLLEFRHGNRSVEFPAGTIQMVKLAGVCICTLDPDDPHLSCTGWTDELVDQWDDFISRCAV